MALAADCVLQCDHLRSLATPNIFANERAELLHINEQINSLDNHIAQLNTLRDALHLRSCQLQPLLTPINGLPDQVLSYIFQQVVGSGSRDDPNFNRYRESLGQAFALSSVSASFRHVALGTPELWQRVPLHIPNVEAIGEALSLLRHCTALAPYINVSVSDIELRREDEAMAAILALLASRMMHKVKAFELYETSHVLLWSQKLNNCFFPMVENLIIGCDGLDGVIDRTGLDFGTLHTMTRLTISDPPLSSPAILPPSIRCLTIYEASEQSVLSLLYQCLNLVECSVAVHDSFGSAPFPRLLILDHLKRLYSYSWTALGTIPSVKRLRLPSLEFLHLKDYYESNPRAITLLCRNVSATLTTLIIIPLFGWSHNDLYKLCGSTFPKLTDLEFGFHDQTTFLSTCRLLSPPAGERNIPAPQHLPALKNVTLGSDIYDAIGDPRSILDLLKNWWAGDSLSLTFKFTSLQYKHEDWPLALRDELKLIVGSRQVNITWGKDEWKVLEAVEVSEATRENMEMGEAAVKT